MRHNSTTTILIADDHHLFREGLRKLLEEEDGLQVVGQASDGEEAVRLAADLKPDVVTVDIVMPKLNGLEAAKQIKSKTSTAQPFPLHSGGIWERKIKGWPQRIPRLLRGIRSTGT